MKPEIDRLLPYFNQCLIGRRIVIEDLSDNGKTFDAERISELHLIDGVLTIVAEGISVDSTKAHIDRIESKKFTGNISDIVDSSVSDTGRIVFFNWAGYDLIVIYPSTEKK